MATPASTTVTDKPPAPTSSPPVDSAGAAFVAPWRRRQIEKAGGRFVAVAWREVPAT